MTPRAKGHNTGLGPCIDLCRHPCAGRTQESSGDDPFLGSRVAVNYVKGMQRAGCIATIKHFNLNTAEAFRSVNDFYINKFHSCHLNSGPSF